MKRSYLFSFLFFGILQLVLSQESSPIKINATYMGEGFSNFSGGIKTGTTYLGLMSFGLDFNTSNIGLWNNGEFFINIQNTHGGKPSVDYIGDLQVASNIDNGDYTYLYELWYKQDINNFSFQFGVINLNADYLLANNAGLFLNSSFGTQPSASMNMPVSIFPMTALGISLQYKFSELFTLKTGIWDGDPSNLDRDAYNMKWRLSSDEGFLSATELEFSHSKANNVCSSKIKLGLLYHNANFATIADTTIMEKGNMQFHLIADHTIISKPEGIKGKLDAFIQIGYLPDNTINVIPFYLGAGISYTGLFKNNATDVLGIAFAHSSISNEAINTVPNTLPSETAIELTYSLPIVEQISIQPSLQYILNTGAKSNLDNAFVGFLRVIIVN